MPDVREVQPLVAAATAAALGQTAISVANFFVAQAMLVEVPPLALAMLRFGATTAVLAVYLALAPGGPMPRGRDLWLAAGLGVLGVASNQGFFFAGLAESTPARASLLYALAPLVVLVIGVLRGIEAFTGLRALALLAALAGVGLVLSEGGDLGGATLRGDLLLLCGTLSWAAYTAFGKELLLRQDTLRVTAVAMIAGTLVFLPIGLPAAAEVSPNRLSVGFWAGLAFMVLFTSIVAYNLWYVAVRHLPASRVAVFMNLQPPLTISIAWAVFGEPIGWRFLLGAALALLGVVLAQRR